MSTTRKSTVTRAIATGDLSALRELDWTQESVRTWSVEAAASATAGHEQAEQSALVVHSIVAYGLWSQSMLDTKEQKDAYALAISRSATRLSDFVLYGTAYVRHGITGDLFRKLCAAASGGHRKAIAAVIRSEEPITDLAAFEAVLDEAIALEKDKAAKRTAERKEAAAREKAAKAAAEEAGVTTLDAMSAVSAAVSILEQGTTLTEAEVNVWHSLATRIFDHLGSVQVKARDEQAA